MKPFPEGSDGTVTIVTEQNQTALGLEPALPSKPVDGLALPSSPCLTTRDSGSGSGSALTIDHVVFRLYCAYENQQAASNETRCTGHVKLGRLAVRTCHSLDIEMPANDHHNLCTKNVSLEMYRLA